LRLFSFGGYGLALVALALVVFGARGFWRSWFLALSNAPRQERLEKVEFRKDALFIPKKHESNTIISAIYFEAPKRRPSRLIPDARHLFFRN